LWNGISAYDITKDRGERTFNLRAVLLWTIHDFPGYGIVGGFSHQGYAACPWCGPDLGAQHLTELGKQMYSGTRRWLPEDHLYRAAEMKEHFDGNMETHGKPDPMTIEEQLRNAVQYQAWRDAGNRPGVPKDPSKLHGMKRTSILKRLPYWEVCASNRNASGSFIVILVRSSWLRERTRLCTILSTCAGAFAHPYVREVLEKDQ
jgi:hypothetical protein